MDIVSGLIIVIACEDLTKLTGKKWNFIRVNKKLFESHDFKTFEELIKARKQEVRK